MALLFPIYLLTFLLEIFSFLLIFHIHCTLKNNVMEIACREKEILFEKVSPETGLSLPPGFRVLSLPGTVIRWRCFTLLWADLDVK
jgi:hypothetical protein